LYRKMVLVIGILSPKKQVRVRDLFVFKKTNLFFFSVCNYRY
jgi:hypothetical protein